MTTEVHVATPTWSAVAKAISDLVTERDGEWCGFPMPVPGLGLVLESKNPYAAKVAEIQQIADEIKPPTEAVEATSEDHGWRIVNTWHSPEKGGRILVLHHRDGRKTWALDPDAPRRNLLWLGPIETLDAWNVETECAAMDALAELLSQKMFKAYFLTGTFLELSKRSGLNYFFRRCRPTLVLSGNEGSALKQKANVGEMRIICALCLHPVGYYENTFAGAMTPTDEGIPHLLP